MDLLRIYGGVVGESKFAAYSASYISATWYWHINPPSQPRKPNLSSIYSSENRKMAESQDDRRTTVW